jgi:lambda family phage portal protein
MATRSLLDRSIGYLAPLWALRRQRARVATEMLARHYDAASHGRRTQGWRRAAGDANAAVASGLSILRNQARDLVRNNPHADSAVDTIGNDAVGWGIVAKPRPENKRAAEAWAAWADTPACDSDGRHDFYGLQKLVMRTVVESGECLVRRRMRRPEDGLPLPVQLQVLEPDYLDTARTGMTLPNGSRIIHGIEFDILGRRAAYYLFPEHPGAQMFGLSIGGALGGTSRRVPAESVLHIYRQKRPGQVRGPSWFAPVILKLKDYDDYDDAQLMKQKIAACLAVLTSDVDGTAPPLGATNPEQPEIDSLEPGMILNVPPGRTIEVVKPPSVGEFKDYSEVTLRAIATGLGVTYEALTGDFTELPFSAARMSRLQHWSRVYDWRWQMLIPQLCHPVWQWAMQVAQIMGVVRQVPEVQWTAPPMPMIEIDKEGLAYMRMVRCGLMSHSEALRELGYEPEETMQELADDFARIDRLKLVLDIDPRQVSQAGQTQARSAGTVSPEPGEFAEEEDEEGDKPAGQKDEEGGDQADQADEDEDEEDEAAS